MYYILYAIYLEDYIGIVGFRVWGRWCDRLRVTLNWRKLRANNSSSVCLSTTQGKTRSTKDFWEKKVEWETQFQIEIRVRTTKRIEKSTRSGHDHIEREVLWVKDGHTSCISSYSLSDNNSVLGISLFPFSANARQPAEFTRGIFSFMVAKASGKRPI